MTSVLHSLRQFGRTTYSRCRDEFAERRLPSQLAAAQDRLARYRDRGLTPRIVVVKQDINEDLYCCPPHSTPREIVESTLLRSGPASLFSDWDAEFLIVETLDEPDCSIWQERATHLKWVSLDFYRSYRDLIPGRDYGQKKFALQADAIDWNQYDVVISIDTAVPARITRRFPNTLWCYYVREVKAPAYEAGMRSPHPGQDLMLNHRFRLRPARLPAHVLEFPYHLQSFGCFHRIFGKTVPNDCDRSGVFVDHFTMVEFDAKARQELEEFGPLSSPYHADGDESGPATTRLARRTMEPEFRERLLNSRYFLITPGLRSVFGTAVVEAIAAGCLAIGSRRNVGCGEFFTENTVAESIDDALTRIRRFEQDENLYHAELKRQRNMVDYLCYVRPMLHLVEAVSKRHAG